MKTKLDGRVKVAPELKAKIIQFCLEHPKEKQLIADANCIGIRAIQIWLKALKKPVLLTDNEKQQKAIEIIKRKYSTYFN